MNDPRDIDLTIKANAQQAIAANEAFIRSLKKTATEVAALQKQMTQMYQVGTAQEARQLRSALSAISGGTKDTQISSAGESASKKNILNNEASRAVRIAKAQTQADRDQVRVMDDFLVRYDRMIKAKREIAALDKRALAGNAEAIRQQKALRAGAQRDIDELGGMVSDEKKRTAMVGRLNRTMDDPTYRPQKREGIAASFWANRFGSRIQAEESAAIVQAADAARAEAEAAVARKNTARIEKERAVERGKELTAQGQAERTLHQRQMREYRKTGLPGILTSGNTADMDAAHRARVDEFERRFNTANAGRVGAGAFDRSSFDEEYRIARERDAQKRAESDARRQQSENDRRQRAVTSAPQEQAAAGFRRGSAFGGAGLLATQANILANYASVAAAIGSVTYLISYVVELEAAMKQLQAISSATDGELKTLEGTIIGLSRSTKFSAKELAEAATVMAQAGLSAQQISASLPAITKLAVGTGTDLATTVDTITSTMTIFNLQTSEATDVANTLTAAMNLSKLSIDKYALGLQYSGNIADTVGIQYNELASLMGGMADAGVRSGSTLGTGLRQLLLDLQAPTDKAKGVFKRLGLSKSELDIESQGIFRVLRNLKEAGFSTADATSAFEVRAVAAFKALMNKLPDIEQLNQRILQTEAATEAAAVQMDSLAAKGSQLASTIGSAFYRISENAREGLKGALDGLRFLFTAVEALGPVLNVATTAVIALMFSMGVKKLLALAAGMVEFRAYLISTSAAMLGLTTATTGATAAQSRFAAVTALVKSPLLLATVALTALSFAFSAMSENSQKAEENLEKAKEATNLATAEMNSTKETVEALDGSIQRLAARYGVLSEKDSPDLKSEIASLQSRFAEYGLTLNQTTDDIDSVIAKTAEMRAELSETMALQGRLALTALQMEDDAAARASVAGIKDNKVTLENYFIDSLKYWSGQDWGPNVGTRDSIRYLDRGGFADQTGAEATKNVFTKYNNAAFNFDETAAKNLDLEEVLADVAEVSRFRDGLTKARLEIQNRINKSDRLQQGDEGKLSGKELKKYQQELKNIDYALGEIDTGLALVDQFRAIASTRKNNSLKAEGLEKEVAMADTIALVNGMNFDFLVGKLNADINEGLLNIETLVEESYGADVVMSATEGLAATLKDRIKGLKDAKTELLDRMVTEGIVGTTAEAEEIFRTLPIADAYTKAVYTLDRDQKVKAVGANELDSDLYSKMASANTARYQEAVQRGGVYARASKTIGKDILSKEEVDAYIRDNKEDLFQTYGKITPNALSLEEALDMILAAYAGQAAAIEGQMAADYPGVFDKDAKGAFKNPTRVAQYNEEIEKAVSQRETAIARLYQLFGVDYTSASGSAGGKRQVDEEIELLRARSAELKATMSRIFGSVDAQSSEASIEGAIAAYSEKFEEYREVFTRLKALEWDDKAFKDPSRAAEFRGLMVAARDREIDEVGQLKFDDFTNMLGDSSGRKKSRAAGARLTNLQATLDQLTTGDEMLTEEMFKLRIEAINGVMAEMVEAYREEFINNPSNRESYEAGEPEIMDRLSDEIAEFVLAKTQAILTTLNKSVDDRLYAAGAGVRSAEGNVSKLDNPVNSGRVSNTERAAAAQGVVNAGVQQLRDNVETYGDEVSYILSLLDQKDAEIAAIPADQLLSPEALAALQARIALEGELTQARRDQAEATDALSAATGKAADPKLWNLMGNAVGQFVQQEGILLSASETIADGIGGVFNTMRQSITDAVIGIVTATKDTGDAFREMGMSIFRSILDLSLKILTNYLIIQGLKLIASMLPGGFSSGLTEVLSVSGFSGVDFGGKKALGGEIKGGVPGRDSVLVQAMPGEIMMRKSAVDMIGKDTLLRANATGKLAQQTSVMMQSNKKEPDMVNVYVVSPDQKPPMSNKDIVVAVMDDVRQGGSIKKMIKQVAVGSA